MASGMSNMDKELDERLETIEIQLEHLKVTFFDDFNGKLFE